MFTGNCCSTIWRRTLKQDAESLNAKQKSMTRLQRQRQNPRCQRYIILLNSLIRIWIKIILQIFHKIWIKNRRRRKLERSRRCRLFKLLNRSQNPPRILRDGTEWCVTFTFRSLLSFFSSLNEYLVQREGCIITNNLALPSVYKCLIVRLY